MNTIKSSVKKLADQIASSPSASFFLKRAVTECLARDPLDALRDAEILVALLTDNASGDHCNCHLDQDPMSPVPNYCAAHDGDYSTFLASNNCD